MRTKILLSILFIAVTLSTMAQGPGRIIKRNGDTIVCIISDEGHRPDTIKYKTKKMESFDKSFDINGTIKKSEIEKIIYDNGKEVPFHRQESKLKGSDAIRKKFNNYHQSKKGFWYRIGDGPGPGWQRKIAVGVYLPLTDTLSKAYNYGLGGSVTIGYASENCGFDVGTGLYTMKEDKNAHGGESESKLTFIPVRVTIYILLFEEKEWRPYIGGGGGCYIINQVVNGTGFSKSFFKELDFSFGAHVTIGIKYNNKFYFGGIYNNITKAHRTRYLGFNLGFIF